MRVPDSCRLGEVGDGWKVTLTTLGFERGADGPPMRVGGGYDELLALAVHRQPTITLYLGGDTKTRPSALLLRDDNGNNGVIPQMRADWVSQ